MVSGEIGRQEAVFVSIIMRKLYYQRLNADEVAIIKKIMRSFDKIRHTRYSVK